MSEWNKVPDDDIDIDIECCEVNIYAGSNDFGNIYAVLSFSQILDVADKVRKIDPPDIVDIFKSNGIL